MKDSWKAAPDLVCREIRGSMIIVPIRKRSADLNSFYSLNESAALLWKRLQNGATLSDLVHALVREFEIDAETARTDAVRAIEEMERCGLVTRISEL